MKTFGCTALSLIFLSACQDPMPPQLPSDVRDAVRMQLSQAGVDAEEVSRASSLFKPVNLTSQAAPDWMVDFGALPSMPLCGTGGCPLQVWVKADRASYRLAFEHQVLGHDVERHNNGRSWLAVALHGALCGGTGSDDCKYYFEWHGNADAPDGYFSATSIWGKPARYEGPLVQVLPVQVPIGSAVAKAQEEYRAACAAAGGAATLDDALTFVPDLNRDGRQELLFDLGWAYCQRNDERIEMQCAGDTCKTRLFTEEGGQGWRVAWSGEPFAYAIDFTQAQPRLLTRAQDCPEPCAENALVWQEARHKFVIPQDGPSTGR